MPVTVSGSGPVAGVTSLNTTVSDVELGFLDGVTSAIQTQINTAGGLVKITDQSFSAVSSVSVNNCFTSTYDNYRIIVSNLSGSGTLTMRLRASAADAATNYIVRGIVEGDASFAASRINSGTSFDTQIGTTAGAGSCQLVLDVINPQDSIYTTINYFVAAVGSASTGGLGTGIGCHYTASAYDGISLLATSITGDIRIYGYRN